MSAVHSIGAALLLAAVAASAPAQTPAAPPAPARPAAPAQPATPPQLPAPAAPATPAQPAFDVQVVTAPAVHAIVLPMKGSYMQHPDAFGRLGTFLTGHNVKPEGPIFARYYSDPSVGEANLVWEVGIAVPAGTTAEAPFEVKDIPSALTAVHAHQGALEELGSAWGTMIQWVTTNGYQMAGPPTQVFKGDMMSGPPQVEMQVPVAK
jgi:effector-binding domain-containing protein